MAQSTVKLNNQLNKYYFRKSKILNGLFWLGYLSIAIISKELFYGMDLVHLEASEAILLSVYVLSYLLIIVHILFFLFHPYIISDNKVIVVYHFFLIYGMVEFEEIQEVRKNKVWEYYEILYGRREILKIRTSYLKELTLNNLLIEIQMRVKSFKLEGEIRK